MSSNVKIIFNVPEVITRHTVISSGQRIQRNTKTIYTEEVLLECSYEDMPKYVYSIDATLHSEYILECQSFVEEHKTNRLRMDKWVNHELRKLVNQG